MLTKTTPVYIPYYRGEPPTQDDSEPECRAYPAREYLGRCGVTQLLRIREAKPATINSSPTTVVFVTDCIIFNESKSLKIMTEVIRHNTYRVGKLIYWGTI